jgi:membrane protease YdiL (CAAX protease family)
VSETPPDEARPGSEAFDKREDRLPPSPPPHSPTIIEKIFIGPNGIRAGWRLLIFVVLLLCLIPVARFVGHLLTEGRPPSSPAELSADPINLVLGALIFLLVVAATFFMSKIEGRPMRAYGIPARGAFGRNFWVGALAGFLALTVLMLTICALGDFRFGGIALTAPDIARYGALWGISFLFTGFFEEYLFRGYPLFTLSTGIGFWPAAILLSLFFAFAHSSNTNENFLGLIEIVPIALFFCLTLRRTGSLWFAIGYHAAWDWGESFFYGIPDSGAMAKGHLLNGSLNGPTWITGGSAGPEGSMLLLPLMVLVFWLFHLAYRKSNYPDPELVRRSRWRLSH